MLSLKAHFDGTAIVLDEPATLAVGQVVRVVIESVAPEPEKLPDRLDQPWKGKVRFFKDVDDVIEQHWDEWYKENTP